MRFRLLSPDCRSTQISASHVADFGSAGDTGPAVMGFFKGVRKTVAKPDPAGEKLERKKNVRWIITIFLTTIFVSGSISLLSDAVMENSGMVVAFLILLVIVSVGILFDIIGVAVASADEKPFHSMAARKVPGAREAIALLRNAEKVSSICNDVVGDICGVVSGSASATIAAQLLTHFSFTWPQVVSLVMSALVAALTVGGKAIGKGFAMGSCTTIVQGVGRLLYTWHHVLTFFRKKKK